MNTEQQCHSDHLYEQHLTHLSLQGKRPATIDAYSRALRRITHHFDKAPDTLTTDDLKHYFAQLIKTHSWSTVKINRNGLQFFFKHATPCLAATAVAHNANTAPRQIGLKNSRRSYSPSTILW
ncbi:site-specific integrase [Photobacterium nomapromontoriensis]|uniref:site-specific integrase n=1 Tax=Photobacterium nomapromontoriensis TaxID=2910237 RepID=UPI003D14F12B